MASLALRLDGALASFSLVSRCAQRDIGWCAPAAKAAAREVDASADADVAGGGGGVEQRAAAVPAFATGTRVELGGLRAKPELNGSLGSVVGGAGEDGRFPVRCDGAGGEVFALKPENIMAMQQRASAQTTTGKQGGEEGGGDGGGSGGGTRVHHNGVMAFRRRR